MFTKSLPLDVTSTGSDRKWSVRENTKVIITLGKMFGRKQNQTVQLISVTPLETKQEQDNLHGNCVKLIPPEGAWETRGERKDKEVTTPSAEFGGFQMSSSPRLIMKQTLVQHATAIAESDGPMSKHESTAVQRSATDNGPPQPPPSQANLSHVSKAPAKTKYPDIPLDSCDPFRDRTDTENSIRFDVSYDL